MANHPEHHDDPQPVDRKRGVLIAVLVGVVLVVVVLLHLTGVIGAGPH